MMRIVRHRSHWITLCFVTTLLFAAQSASAQDTTTPPAQTPEPAAPVTAPAESTPVATAPSQTPTTPSAKAAKQPKSKNAKAIYTGPTTVITEPGTPMLDEEGKQLIDPAGKPMFNPPSIQMRDKKGHPVFDADGKPVFRTATDAGYDEKGKRIPIKRVKPVKITPVVISRGTFTVDGMIGKAELNYTIPNFKFVYLYAPGIGTAIVSNSPFQGATAQKDGFSNNTLTVYIEDHKLQLASDKQIIGKHGHPEPAYVEVDRQFRLPSKFPVVGYGTTLQAPFAWPGSKRNQQIAGVKPPPTPKDLLPVILLPPCPSGQMRVPGTTVLPGETPPDEPCVPISKALQYKAALAAQEAAHTETKTAEKSADSTGSAPAALPASATPPPPRS